MSRDDANIPPDLREALTREGADDEQSTDLETVWALLDRAEPSDDALPDAEDTWEGVRRHIEANRSSEEGERPSRNRRSVRASSKRGASRRRLWYGSGVVAVVLVLTVAVWWWTQPIEVSTPPGTTLSHTLPDGSTVELNAATRLTYPRSFSALSILEADRRVVRLRGEAYFEVESRGRPFVVQTATARVEVVGTSFSVQSRDRQGGETEVALAEGRLRVTGPEGRGGEVTLRPGQAVTVGGGRSPSVVRDTSVNRILAWRRGGFAVTSKTLPEIVRALERRFGQTVRLDASIPESTRTAGLTLYYSQPVGLESILHDVSMARSLTYRATASGYVLSRSDDS